MYASAKEIPETTKELAADTVKRLGLKTSPQLVYSDSIHRVQLNQEIEHTLKSEKPKAKVKDEYEVFFKSI